MQTEIVALSELERKRVWEGWLACEMRGCYFAELVQYYQNLQRGLTWLALISSSGASVAIASHWAMEWPKLVLALITTLLSLALLVLRNEERALKCSDLHLEWNRLANHYRALWDDMYSDQAAARLAELSDRVLELGKSSAIIPYKEKRMRKCQRYVERQHATA